MVDEPPPSRLSPSSAPSSASSADSSSQVMPMRTLDRPSTTATNNVRRSADSPTAVRGFRFEHRGSPLLSRRAPSHRTVGCPLTTSIIHGSSPV
jgi:hypothetical protein